MQVITMSLRASVLWSMILLLPFFVEGKLPLYPGIKPCSLKMSPEVLRACAIKHGNEALPSFISGNRQYKIPKMNPLRIEKLIVGTGDGSLGLRLVLKNVDTYGFQDTVIKDVEFDLTTKSVAFAVFVPQLYMVGEYDISGRIVLLPIRGHGNSNITLDNVYARYEYDYYFKKDNEGDYFFVPKPNASFDFNTTRLYTNLENLFNGDKLLGENTNKFMNENWEEVFTSVKPIISSAISEIIYNTLETVFRITPMKEAFLDSEDFKFD